MVEIERETDKREAQTTTLIIDSKTSQNADAAETKGYDVGKKTGIKLTAADVTDRDGAVRMITRFCDATDYLDFLKEVMTDRGYTGEKFAEAVKSISGSEVEVVKRNDLHTFVALPKRWIVERTFGWLDKCHRLWKNCERLLHNSLQMIFLAFIRLLLARY